MNEERKAHIVKALEAGVRIDGRKADEFRPIEIKLGVSSTAEGSAEVTAGETKIIAGVKMGLGSPYPDTPDSGVLMVNAELPPLANPEFETGPPSIVSIETARVIDRGIRESHAFDTKSLCVEKGEKVWMVQCDIIPINYDGNVLDIGGLATLAALLDARYPSVNEDGKADYHKSTDKTLSLQRYPLPITIGKIGNYLLVDPTQEEEKALDARVTITVLEDGNICAMQKGLPAPITKDEFKKMVELAQTKSAELRKMLFEVTKK